MAHEVWFVGMCSKTVRITLNTVAQRKNDE